jgi:hypothetical protein
MFFFEKKNQKTFAPWGRLPVHVMPRKGGASTTWVLRAFISLAGRRFFAEPLGAAPFFLKSDRFLK